MKKILLLGLLSVLNLSLNASGKNPVHPRLSGQKITVTHFNITFAQDLSNRVNPDLYKRPLNDMDLLKILTNDLYPTILRFKRSENQKDRLLIDFINKELINQYKVHTDKLLIDFGRFPRQNDRINYIMEHDHVRQTLRQDVNAMTAEFERINNEAARQNFGADIWTYLDEGIDNKNVMNAEKPVTDDVNTYVNTYRNVLILTTDGYIEAGIYNQGVDLSKKTIDKFRQAFMASGLVDVREFFQKNPQFRIKPVHNYNLKNLEILIMELYDRSKSKTGAATVHPTDMEIMKLFWMNWLQQSNVKRFELHACAGSKDEAEKIMLNFFGVPKVFN